MKNISPLSYIEISEKNLISNVKQFRAFLNKNTQIAGVIKANAYGHGDREIVSIVNDYVDFFQVNSIEEFEKIKSIAKKPVFIFGYTDESGIQKAIKGNAILSVFDLQHASLINKEALNLKKKVRVHVACDSYLGREGFMPNEIKDFILQLKNMKNISVEGVYSHFANIEDTLNPSHSNKQKDAYHEVVKIFKENGFENIKTHISATSGILAYEGNNNLHEIVRLGIGLYGMWPSTDLEKKYKKDISLKPALRWITHVAQVKVLPKGHSVGYGLTYITKKTTKIAVIPQGYADGLSRLMSNNGNFLIKGKKAKILGRVSMNMSVVDVSNIKDVQTGDEVVVLGKQGDSVISPESLGGSASTINYEGTTRINPLLPRVIV